MGIFFAVLFALIVFFHMRAIGELFVQIMTKHGLLILGFIGFIIMLICFRH